MTTVPAVNPVLVVAKAATVTVVIAGIVPVVFALIGIGMPPPANGPLVTKAAPDAASTNPPKL